MNLKNQLDNNFLPNDDINAEASEKKPISMNVIEITKAMSNEVMNHVTIEIENLRQATVNMDRKLQFHMNLMSENIGAVYNMIKDVHEAIVDKDSQQSLNVTVTTPSTTTTPTSTTTTQASSTKQSKLDRLVEQIHPMLTVSEKMDEVWNVVVSKK